MRQVMHDAVAEAREMMGSVVDDLRSENVLTEDELLTRYEQQHQGRPFAILDFAGQKGGGDAMTEALRYEKQMEQLRTKRGGV